MTKRSLDVVAAALGLLVTAPVFLIMAAAIYITDGAPILFRQRRIGWRGRPFTIFKFRTMRVVDRNEFGRFDAGNTSRVTWLGRLMRKSKLDELPQFWNVLRGDMSLVGPRPEVEQWVTVYPDRWAHVHEVRPGITDPASILFRSEEEILSRVADPEATYREVVLPRKLSLYESYVKTHSFLGDLRIIFQTLVAILNPPRATE